MKHYHQLTREQRYGIYTLLKTGHNQAEIALTLGVHKSTITFFYMCKFPAWILSIYPNTKRDTLILAAVKKIPQISA